MTFAPASTAKSDRDNGTSLRWHIVGGNNKHRIGANSGMLEYEGRFYMFDAGLMSNDPKKPENPAFAEGSAAVPDTVVPDFSRYLEKPGDPSHKPEHKLEAIFLTHGHPDHIGALAFLALMGYKLPKLYATPYTARRIEQEFSNAGLPSSEWPDIYEIEPGKPVKEGPVSVTAFWVSHSTPQSAGFFIETPAGNLLNPGDFKLDQSVVWGPAFNEDQFQRVIAGKSVDLLLLDSTGADRDVMPITEEDVRESMRNLMEKYPNKRFVVAVMGGFEENLASVAKVTAEYGRTLWVAGWSHEQSLAALKETGMSLGDSIGENLKVRTLSGGAAARDLAASAPGSSVVVVTGATGKPNAVLTRSAEGKNKDLRLDPENDIILIAAPSMPGQEGTRRRMLAQLEASGMYVMTREDAPLYAHAHARLPELAEFVRLARPKLVLPIHGDADLRRQHKEALEKMGQKTISADNGAVIRVARGEETRVESRGSPQLVGFKTLTGSGWKDRFFVQVPPAPENQPPAAPVPANGNGMRRPVIFTLG